MNRPPVADDDSTDDEEVYRTSSGRRGVHDGWGDLTAFDEFKRNIDEAKPNNLSVGPADDNFILRAAPTNGDGVPFSASENDSSGENHNEQQRDVRRRHYPGKSRLDRRPWTAGHYFPEWGTQSTGDPEIPTKTWEPAAGDDTDGPGAVRKKSVNFQRDGNEFEDALELPKINVDIRNGFAPSMIPPDTPTAVSDTVNDWRKSVADHHPETIYEETSYIEGAKHLKTGKDLRGVDNPAFRYDIPNAQATAAAGAEEVSRHVPLDWDVFRAYQHDTSLYNCEGLYKFVQKALKVLFVVISFMLILATLVMSKLSLLFATSNMNVDFGFKKNFGECSSDNLTGTCTVGVIPGRERQLTDNQCGVPVTYETDELKRRDVIRWMWCVWMSMCLPYLITFVHSIWKICFKNKKAPTCRAVAFAMFMESLHVGGVTILCLIVLPGVDVFRAMFLLNSTALYPSFMKLFLRPKTEQRRGCQIFGDFLSFLFQLAIIVLYIALTIWGEGMWDANAQTSPYNCTASLNNRTEWLEFSRCGPHKEIMSDPKMILLPIALFLTSFGWWQNFVGKELNMSCARAFNKLSKEVKKGKTKISAIVAIWKIIFSFALFLVIGRFYTLGSTSRDIRELFGLYSNSTSPFHDHNFKENVGNGFESDWLIVFGINAISGLICYIISLHAIQARVQRVTYSIALLLATPVSFIFALYGFCLDCTDGSNIASRFRIDDLYWNCFDGFNNMAALVSNRPIVLVGFAVWLSQLVLGRHLWAPRSQRLAKPGRLFVKPFYCGVLLEQSMVYNRARNDKYKHRTGKLPRFKDNITPEAFNQDVVEEPHNQRGGASRLFRDEFDDNEEELTKPLSQMNEPLFDRKDRSKPMVFACATMWHENEQEMIQMMKSIIRLDQDQCIRRLTQDFFKVEVMDYYDFETHIFFDDAFEKYIPGDPMFKVNRFVELFVQVMNSAASYVHRGNVVIAPPVKIPTPYGGRLEYTLPGNNKLVLHLKDKQKIRHKKRWSQVMYMYYLLGYRLWNNPVSRKVKEEVAYNTYILTLDGDVDFKPDAVKMLIDLMKRDYSVGAACGRIHPEGHGPMVWYQKFEYAISHWLQKSTEHVLGCVLCSPGCFSLFRAAALMDDNIMKTYSKTAEGAGQHVQYDQGEDRWLCTLLLQRGYRVEYSAAADALTFAPEGFNEFFNQRRRWTPSTFANVLDLLRSGRQTSARNENISFLYIIYQGGLLASSVLGPATIFLMTVGAFSAVFTTMTATGTFFMAFVPLAVFFALCLLAPSNIQLGFGAILGGLFAIAQMVVLVGLIAGIAADGLCSPTSWFLLVTAGIFLISAILHPQEFTNVLHGILYFLAIPTMYLLLIIYSLCNLHVVSWGTREVVQTKAEQERLKQRETELTQQAAQAPGRLSRLVSMFGANKAAAGKEDGWTLSCGTCCRCLCCPRPGESPTDKALHALDKKVNVLLGKITKDSAAESSESSEEEDDDVSSPLLKKTTPVMEDQIDIDENSVSDEPPIDYLDIDPKRPYWTTLADSVERGPVEELNADEEKFWVNLIKRYLEPIDKNPEREERIAKELKSLRNRAVIGFFMIDLIFIVLIQTLQTIPEGGGTPGASGGGYFMVFNCTDPVTGRTDEQQIEPIGFAFLLVFGLFLIIQFFGMLFHRLFSLIQIVSATVVCGTRKEDKNKDYVELTKKIFEADVTIEDISNPSSGSSTQDTSSRRTSVTDDNLLADHTALTNTKLGAVSRLEQPIHSLMTMDKTFARNFVALEKQIGNVPIEEAPGQRRMSRSNSLFQRAFSISVNPGSARKRSEHANTVMDIARRKKSIFTKKRAAQIQEHYEMTDSEIQQAQRKLTKVFPEVSEPKQDYEVDSVDDW